MAASKKSSQGASPRKKVVVKKTAPKKTPKKSTTVKKTSTKKATVKKVAPKKKVAQKKVVKKNNSVKTTTKTTKTDIPNDNEEFVVLPSNAPLRAKRKAVAIAEELIEMLQTPAFYIAYVSAICFVLVGLSLMVSGILRSTDGQLAQLLTSTTSIEKELDNVSVSGATDVANTAVAPISKLTPEFVLLDKVPSEITDDVRIAFSLKRI